MVKLILEVNPKAGSEAPVLDKVLEVFGNPFVSQIEQLSDFYVVIDLCQENIKKASSIQDFPGILDMKATVVDVEVASLDKAQGEEDYYIVFVQTQTGRRVEAMNALKNLEGVKLRNAGYIYDNRADIILEVLSEKMPSEIVDQIRAIDAVEDTIFYNLPRVR
ncbi:MAG: hypothetical protein IIV64_07320 [Muribaculaceae bacterium]|jgi:hypothetical protein|nr:hypothetical protein [Muribaculaceae bacterium]